MISEIKDMQTLPLRRSDWQKEDGAKYLIAIDVDGTLVNHDGAMSEGVKKAAQEVVDAGHHVVISTGRSLGATLPIVGMIGLTRGYAVSSNGAVTLSIDPAVEAGYRIIDKVTFDPSPAITLLKAKLPQASLALEAPDGTVYATDNFEDWSFGVNTVKTTRTKMAAMNSAVRVVVCSPSDTPADFKRAIYDSGLHGVNYAVGWSAWLDVAAHGVTKATALEQIRRKLHVDPRHTIAIGDGLNDKEMIHWAARGVAMGQAAPEVAELATDVTGSVYEDGLVPILRDLL
ncbi:HAD family hydrolase [Rothia sp. 32237D007AR]